MPEVETKPLNWKPNPSVGYTVTRRPDGGMHYTFTDTSRTTLEHWREFALEHLLDSDRLTRNLYDLRQVAEISEEAMKYAIEVSSDPSARNVRIAVVVANEPMRRAVQEVAALATSGAEVGIFTGINEAEAWLDRPLTLLT